MENNNNLFSDFLVNENLNLNPLKSDLEKLKCVICGKVAVLSCSDCGKILYCNFNHQRAHLKTHQNECNFQKYENKVLISPNFSNLPLLSIFISFFSF